MRRLRRMLRWADGTLPVLLATLMLAARLAAPSMAMPAADPLAAFTICHADPADPAPAPPGQPAHADCLLCPACHLLAHAVLPPPPPTLPSRADAPVPASNALPQGAAPPGRLRIATPPTGPPAALA